MAKYGDLSFSEQKPFGKKEVFLGSEESEEFSSNMHKFQGKEPFVFIESSSKETSCLMSNVHAGTESSDECNTSTSNHKTKISLIGVRQQKNGRYGAVITDKIRHKQVWLGTFDTIEEASQAYFSKKSEFEKLNLQGNKVNKPKKNLDQIQQPESPVVPSLSVADDQTLDTASMDGINKRIDSHEATIDIVGVHKNKTTGKEPESSKEASCLMASVHGTESYDECNTSTSCNKGKISLAGIRGQKNRRYGVVITDTIRHKQVWLGTFDTIEEASQAYFSKKSELENEKLNLQANMEKRPNKNPDPVQQPESLIIPSLSVADGQTMETGSVYRRNKRTHSHEPIMDIVGVHKNKTSGKEPEPSKEPACLIANVDGTESYDECNASTRCNPKGNRSLLGIRNQNNGRYGAVITDRTKHKKVWLGTFDTVEEASQAYLSKKSVLKKLGQQGNKSKNNCYQFQQPESPVVTSLSVANHDQTLNSASVSRRNKRIGANRTTPFFKVHKRKSSGKYTTEIKNPISKKRIWLGTVATAEEASQAYQSKKLEFQKLVEAMQQQCTNKLTHPVQDGKSEELVNIKKGHKNVNCELESAGGSEIDVPISNSSNEGTLQWIDSHEIGAAEEAFHAYVSKKFDVQSSKKVELQSGMPTDFSAGERQEDREDDEDLRMGEWVQLPGNRAVKFSLNLGLPIIDNYGSLLGEFSALDDLSICKTEDGNET